MADLRSKVHARGVVWEDKGLSLAVHYRAAEDPARAERDLQTAVANAPHRDVLDIFWGKMILEIRAPTGLNKGHAVRRLVQEWELERLIFLGDDTTDIDAVLAVKEMAERGLIEGFSIVVLHDEAPPRMVEECAYSLQGVPAVSEFLDLSARLSVRK
jgi:trehalose 6-phosphate phosphatase